MLTQLLRLVPRSMREAIIVRSVRFDEASVRGIEVKIAETVDELSSAARVVHDAYVGRGIMAPHASGLKFCPQAVVPSSLTFVAKRDGNVLGTISLLADSPLGLPMDDTYGPEVNALRGRGESCAEVSALAVSPGARRTGVSYLLNRIMVTAAIAMRLDRLVIAVHPDAQELYRCASLFESLGPERQYVGLNRSARAVALSLPLDGLHARLAARFGHMGPVAQNPAHLHFEMPCPTIALPPGELGPSEARCDAYAVLARARMDLFRTLTGKKLAFLKRSLPGVLWPSRSSDDWSREVAQCGFGAEGVQT